MSKHRNSGQKHFILVLSKVLHIVHEKSKVDESQYNESILDNCIFYELFIKTFKEQIILKP